MRFSYLVGPPPISPVQSTPSSCAFKSYIRTPATNQIAETHPSIQSNTVKPSNTQVTHVSQRISAIISLPIVQSLTQPIHTYIHTYGQPSNRVINEKVKQRLLFPRCFFQELFSRGEKSTPQPNWKVGTLRVYVFRHVWLCICVQDGNVRVRLNL